MTEMVKAKLNGRYTIILPKHRADRPEWYTGEGWEKARLESIAGELHSSKIIGKKETMLYVGAEEGEMAALCQIWGAKVVLFEPNPKAWSHIRSIWEANELENPFGIYPGFASDVTELAKHGDFAYDLSIDADGWPNCSKSEMEAAHGFKEVDKESEYFDQVKIDDYVQKNGIIPTAISLDVEGAEGMVLRGAEETLRKHKPKIWLSGHPEFLVENFKGKGGFDSLRAICIWLREMGYKMQLLDFDHELHIYFHI